MCLLWLVYSPHHIMFYIFRVRLVLTVVLELNTYWREHEGEFFWTNQDLQPYLFEPEYIKRNYMFWKMSRQEEKWGSQTDWGWGESENHGLVVLYGTCQPILADLAQPLLYLAGHGAWYIWRRGQNTRRLYHNEWCFSSCPQSCSCWNFLLSAQN